MKKKIGKVEVGRKLGTPVPGYTPELGTRITHAIEQLEGLKAASKIIGVSDESLAQWRDGKARPSFFGLQKLADAAGVSLDWLATGKLPEAPAPQPSEPVAQIDQRLMGRCSDAFGKLYKELGIALSLADLGALAAEAYNDLVAAEVKDMDIPTQLVVIRSLVERHRRELLAEADANAKGKRSAS
jgi:transcriptional regulator with XRE-family HTH domain